MKQIFTKTHTKFSLIGKLTPDRMKLFVDASPVAPKQQVSREELNESLNSEVAAGILDLSVLDDIARMLSEGKETLERRVSKGRDATTGADGHVLMLAKKFGGSVEVKVDARGFATFRDLHLFDNLKKGQVVARLYAPKNGVDGLDALGKVIASKSGKPAKFAVGKGCELRALKNSADGYQEVVATDEGYLFEDKGALQISDEFVVKGDLDFVYGNIDFIGKVKVLGDVLPGFSITAQKGIEVLGSMRGKHLLCPQGDIVVRDIVYGDAESSIVAGKNFSAKIVQQAQVQCHENIVIGKESHDSVLRAEKSVLMPQALLRGGEVFAVCGVEARQIGSESGAVTLIDLCGSVETSPEYSKLQVQIGDHERAITLLRNHLGPLAVHTYRIELLQQPHRSKMEALSKKLKSIEESKVRLLAKRSKMLELSKVSSVHRINFHEYLYQGACVKVGDVQFCPKETIKGPATYDFDASKGEFVLSELKPIECDFLNEQSVAGKGTVTQSQPKK